MLRSITTSCTRKTSCKTRTASRPPRSHFEKRLLSFLLEARLLTLYHSEVQALGICCSALKLAITCSLDEYQPLPTFPEFFLNRSSKKWPSDNSTNKPSLHFFYLLLLALWLCLLVLVPKKAFLICRDNILFLWLNLLGKKLGLLLVKERKSKEWCTCCH